jgi:hypothetical protein
MPRRTLISSKANAVGWLLKPLFTLRRVSLLIEQQGRRRVRDLSKFYILRHRDGVSDKNL